ncbi:MAG TPA: acyltransferase, partial [Bryobacteraceae bacterium]
SYARCRWNRRDLIHYGIARFARVYPVYMVSLLLISYFILEFLTTPGLSNGEKFTTVAAYGLVLQGWMQNTGAGWNTPAWSLSCEFLFYLCLPVVMIWLGQRGRLKLAALCTTALVLPIVLRRTGFPMSWKPILHLGDFLVGIVAARMYSRVRSFWSDWSGRGAWFYLTAIAMGVAVILFPASLGNTVDLGTALRPLNAMLVLGLALGGGAIARLLSTAFVQYLGQASYSMYILHVPLLWWFGNHGPPIFHRMHAGVALIYIAGVILVSAACFEFVEKPANRWIREYSRRRFA